MSLVHPLGFFTGAAAGGGGVNFKTGLKQFWDGDAATSGNESAAFGGIDLTAEGSPGGSATGGPNSSYGYRTCSDSSNSNFVTASNVMTSALHSTGLTLALWFRTSATGDWMFGHDALNGRTGILMPSAGDLRCQLDGATIGDSATSGLNDSGWHSLVLTSSGTTGSGSDELFIDGVSEATHTRGFEVGDAVAYVGANPSGNLEWTGDLCSVGIWDLVADSTWAVAWENGGSNLHYSDF